MRWGFFSLWRGVERLIKTGGAGNQMEIRSVEKKTRSLQALPFPCSAGVQKPKRVPKKGWAWREGAGRG